MNRPNAGFTKKTGLSLTASACLLWLSGCATVPTDLDTETVTQPAIDEATDGWSTTPAISVVNVGKSGGIQVIEPVAISPEIANTEIELSTVGPITLEQVSYLLADLGITIVLAEDSLGDRTVSLTAFKGTVGDLLNIISTVMNASFREQNGVIMARDGLRYMLALPQDEELMSRVAKDLNAIIGGSGSAPSGGSTSSRSDDDDDEDEDSDSDSESNDDDNEEEAPSRRSTSSGGGSASSGDVMISPDAGTLLFKVGTDRQEAVAAYLRKIHANSAMIGLQVAVINVGLNREKKTGIDWSALQATIGSDVRSNLDQDNTQNDTNTDTGDDDTGDDTVGSPMPTSGGGDVDLFALADPVSGQFKDSALQLALGGSDFRLSGLINFLSTYGSTTTNQNLMLRTLSGNEVTIQSGQSTPYVSGVSISTSVGTGGTSGALGGTQTETAETGLDVSIIPRYDAEAELVTMTVDMELSSITSFVELSAGNQVGNLTQPDIQDQSFSNVARIKVGETLILGGLVYNEVSDNRNTISGLEKLPIAGKNDKLSQNALFIVLRPTVIVYE